MQRFWSPVCGCSRLFGSNREVLRALFGINGQFGFYLQHYLFTDAFADSRQSEVKGSLFGEEEVRYDVFSIVVAENVYLRQVGAAESFALCSLDDGKIGRVHLNQIAADHFTCDGVNASDEEAEGFWCAGKRALSLHSNYSVYDRKCRRHELVNFDQHGAKVVVGFTS